MQYLKRTTSLAILIAMATTPFALNATDTTMAPGTQGLSVSADDWP